MKKYILLLFVINIISLGYSQELKRITKRRHSPFSIEKYYVLKSNKNIKQGEYLKISNEKKFERGYYNKNQKDSIWTYFHSNGKDTSVIGRFKNDKPTGKWIFKNIKGETDYIFDYTTNKPAFYNWHDTINLINNQWIEDSIDSPPLMLSDDFFEQFAINFKFPEEAFDKEIDGLIKVSFIVDQKGKMSDIFIKKGLTFNLDKEVYRVLNLIDYTWFPALKNGNPITVKYFSIIRISIKPH